MSLVKLDSLLGYETVAEIEEYMDSLVKSFTNSVDRQRIISYLHSIIEADSLKNRQDVVKLRRARDKLAALQLFSVHHTLEMNSFFSPSSETLAQMITRMTQDDQVIYAENKAFTSDFIVSGKRVTVIGGYSGLASNDTLVPTCTVNGVVKISADDCVLDGIKFQSTTGDRGQNAISFTGEASKLTLRNCVFVGPTGLTDLTRWIWGEGQYFGGQLTIENCEITGFTDVHLADPTTSSSATPSTTITKLVLKDSYFKNKGSLAFRNPATTSGTEATVSGCIFEVPDSGLADLFWSSVEVNNFQTVTIKDCTATGQKKTNDDRGFAQVWSRAGTIKGTFKNNKIASYDVGYQLAQGGTTPNFYGYTADSVFSLPSSDFTDIANHVSVVYPWKNDVTGIQLTPVAGTVQPTVAGSPGISIIGLGGTWVESP